MPSFSSTDGKAYFLNTLTHPQSSNQYHIKKEQRQRQHLTQQLLACSVQPSSEDARTCFPLSMSKVSMHLLHAISGYKQLHIAQAGCASQHHISALPTASGSYLPVVTCMQSQALQPQGVFYCHTAQTSAIQAGHQWNSNCFSKGGCQSSQTSRRLYLHYRKTTSWDADGIRSHR